MIHVKYAYIIFAIGTLGMLLGCNPKTKTSESTSDTMVTSGEPKGEAYLVDAPRSQIQWQGFKPTGSHKGIVPISGGTIYIQDDLLTGGTITLQMDELVVTDDMAVEMKNNLQGHLRGTVPGKETDFFNVTQYPTATYTILSSSVLTDDPVGTHLILGQLTIKDITNPVHIKARLDLANPNAIKVTTEPFVIDRSEWDIRFKSKKFFDNLRDDFINDEIRLEITLGAIREG